MKSFYFMMISVVIGLTTTYNFLDLHHDIKSFSEMINLESNAPKESIRVSGINMNLSQPIHGKLGDFDNLFIKISSTNSISLLDVEYNDFVVHAADETESNRNMNLVGLTFPLSHQKATILNLRKFINHSIKEKGDHIIKIRLSNQEDVSNTKITEKYLKISLN
ncbi:hypothetical protein KMW28_02730 [Flammeovirga yaeyamensis]|uniref:Uncharacterized protein n=1 Tax=Flammeovirga yaeyamensis TaxID=367791 RepID=A0AAX1N4S1_9BACT|nr:hypothetical protein [Flammeovirga yaeyamensis]MBB3700428.1 hypothetical protein [Flammeovirga yaeyamensis]NMF36948.1 hypothetical protein [Flammeovirga yaeyamensis]QWG02506.1 hypothetical protein KMW28_02730 [Flammeovirga yaeyamensis]